MEYLCDITFNTIIVDFNIMTSLFLVPHIPSMVLETTQSCTVSNSPENARVLKLIFNLIYNNPYRVSRTNTAQSINELKKVTVTWCFRTEYLYWHLILCAIPVLFWDVSLFTKRFNFVQYCLISTGAYMYECLINAQRTLESKLLCIRIYTR